MRDAEHDGVARLGEVVKTARIHHQVVVAEGVAALGEDDLVVAPNYMKLCLNTLEWGEKNFSNVGAVQAWNKCIMSKNVKDERLGEVHSTYTNWWGYLLKRTAWQEMEPYILKYQELFLGATYNNRPHRTIVEYFRHMLKAAKKIQGNQRWVSDEESMNRGRAYFNAPPTGQDAITMHALEACGFVRLATTVNRGLYIGKHGIHMHPRMFERDGFPQMSHELYPDDSTRLEFWSRGRKQFNVPEAPADVPKGFQVIEHI